MMLEEAMREACAVVGIEPPRKSDHGRWLPTPVIGKSKGNTSGRVMINDDGQTGVAWNHATGQHQRFWIGGVAASVPAPKRDVEKERRQAAERKEVEQICAGIVLACRQEEHPYLAAKGFPDEIGLVMDDPRTVIPSTKIGDLIASALPECDGPLLIVPGRIGSKVATVQFITAEGNKKNIIRGQMSGAAHRIATGRETWVAEGIGTALTIRAALRSLGRSATVLSAFSASNVAKVASAIPGAIIAADNDKPIETLGGLGAGEYYARKSGKKWTMPPVRGDFNDMHTSEGIRAVALHLREAVPP